MIERPPFDPGTVESLTTVRDLLRWCATVLGHADVVFGHGTDNAWDEAVALIMDGLRLPRDRFDHLAAAHVGAEERRWVARMLARRVRDRVPAPYLTGRGWFAGLPFVVDARALVPRSPLAELIEHGLQPWLGARFPLRILDLAAGGGCIGIAAAYAFERAEVVLADVDSDALALASVNVDLHGLEGRVRCVRSDGFDALAGERFDLILCNPPYVGADAMAALPAEFRHEPRQALAAGVDGLALAERIVREAAHGLTVEGMLVLEVGQTAAALTAHFERVAFLWPELERGGSGVLVAEAADLPVEGVMPG